MTAPRENIHDPAATTLENLGYNERFQTLFTSLESEGLIPGRVIRQDRGLPLIAIGGRAVHAEPATHLIKDQAIDSRATIGDWVVVNVDSGHDAAIIEGILPRSSAFTRKDPGEAAEEQVVAANIDRIFIVQALAPDGPNLRRLERELVLAWESGAIPVVVLSKADLVDDAQSSAEEVRGVALGVEIHVVSGLTGEGVAALEEYVEPGVTAALFGASGVGKSTLVNRLVGAEVMETHEVRASDGRGRHTTVTRELVNLPSGGILIDTPGMRGLGLWDAYDGLSATFPDIVDAAAECRFRDCQHGTEPDCGVLQAVEEGRISPERLQSYQELEGELARLALRRDERARRNSKKQWKTISKEMRRFYRDRGHA